MNRRETESNRGSVFTKESFFTSKIPVKHGTATVPLLSVDRVSYPQYLYP